MLLGETRLVLLDCRLETSLFEILANCLSTDRVVGEGRKLLGNLNSCISLARGEKANSMADMGW